MGNAKLNVWMQWVLLVGVIASLMCSYGAYSRAGNIPTYPTADDIAAKVIIPTLNGNLSVDNSKIDAIYDDLLGDDTWEEEAEVLATNEWEDRDYREIYKALDNLFRDIDEKEDIDKVVIKDDTEFNAMDEDDKDGNVIQYVKVYYEDINGDDKKVYLTIDTEIEDNEVENIEITKTK